MKKIFYLAILISVACASCQEHIEIDGITDYAVGDIVLQNGSIMPYNKYIVSDRNDAMAVIYVTQREVVDLPSKALAIFIDELTQCSFGDTLIIYGCSTDTASYNGYENTLKLRTSSGSQLGDRMNYILPDFQNAFIPSVAEILPLHPVINQVNDVLESINGTAIKTESPDCWYWTSTEMNVLDAYTYSPTSDLLLPAVKTLTYSARPIFKVNY